MPVGGRISNDRLLLDKRLSSHRLLGKFLHQTGRDNEFVIKIRQNSIRWHWQSIRCNGVIHHLLALAVPLKFHSTSVHRCSYLLCRQLLNTKYSPQKPAYIRSTALTGISVISSGVTRWQQGGVGVSPGWHRPGGDTIIHSVIYSYSFNKPWQNA